MALKGVEFDKTAGEKLAVVFNPERAQKLFEGSGHTLQELRSCERPQAAASLHSYSNHSRQGFSQQEDGGFGQPGGRASRQRSEIEK